METQLTEKLRQGTEALHSFLTRHPQAALAFSGGCDSSLLLAAAVRAGCRVQPYFIKGPFQPEFELEDARRLCSELGVALKVLPAAPLSQESIAENGPRRCYFCKKLIFTRLVEAARSDGFAELWDGTNASDAEDDRPGMQALRELQVLSPLRLSGLTKPQVREASRQMGLFTWDKPAYACLATRIPTGIRLEAAQLERVERAESALFALGFSNLRVRVMGDTAKLQLPASQLTRAAQLYREIGQALRPWFAAVLLDLEPRTEVL